MKPVAEIAREIADAIPADWGTAIDLRRFADGIFLELPETRNDLLRQLVSRINSLAEGCDTTKEPWPTIRRIFETGTNTRRDLPPPALQPER